MKYKVRQIETYHVGKSVPQLFHPNSRHVSCSLPASCDLLVQYDDTYGSARATEQWGGLVLAFRDIKSSPHGKSDDPHVSNSQKFDYSKILKYG